MKEYEIDKCVPSHADFTLDEDLNADITETAGFVPLEVKFRQFEQNGIRAQFSESDFTSSDLREIYLSPDTQIYPGDDLIDIEEKLALQAKIMADKKAKMIKADETADAVSKAPGKKEKAEKEVKEDE